MRKTYRDKKPLDYWTDRWKKIQTDSMAEADDCYPLLYANKAVTKNHRGQVLELGCGPGRLLRYYHMNCVDIVGVDFVDTVIHKLRATDAELKVTYADARELPFDDCRFSAVLCFGVFHCLEDDVSIAVSEAFRVLKPGGKLCAEFRADSIHNRLIDFYKGNGRTSNEFHKCNYHLKEAREILVQGGFTIEQELPAINMPLFYHIPFLRHRSQVFYDEHVYRARGYQLRPWVERMQAIGFRLAPKQMSNLYIFICHKPCNSE